MNTVFLGLLYEKKISLSVASIVRDTKQKQNRRNDEYSSAICQISRIKACIGNVLWYMSENKYCHMYQFPAATLKITAILVMKTIEIYSLISQKFNISFTELKSDFGRFLLSLEAVEKNPFLVFSSFLWLPIFLGLWPHHCNLDSIVILHYSFLSVENLPHLSLMKIYVIIFRAHFYNLR